MSIYFRTTVFSSVPEVTEETKDAGGEAGTYSEGGFNESDSQVFEDS